MVDIEERVLVSLPKARNKPQVAQSEVVLIHEELLAAQERDYRSVRSYEGPVVGGDKTQAICNENPERCSLCESIAEATVTLYYKASDSMTSTTEITYCSSCNEEVVTALDEYIESHASDLLTDTI